MFKGMSRNYKGARDNFALARDELRQAGAAFDETRSNLNGDSSSGRAQNALPASLSGDLGAARGFVGLGKLKANAGAQNRVRNLFTPDAPTGGGGGSGKARQEVDQVAAAYERMNAQMAETIALFGKTTEVAKVRYDLENGELSKLTEGQKTEILQKAAQIDLLKEQADAQAEATKTREAEQQALEQHQETVKSLLEDIAFETELTSLNNDERERAIQLRYANVDAASAEG